jgi:nucleoside-diphosphate-sugar epimerase
MVAAADRDRCWVCDMKILIFGGTGFVGLNIAAALLARGHAVTLFDRAGGGECAQRVGLPAGLLPRFPHQCSGGQKVRIRTASLRSRGPSIYWEPRSCDKV